MAHDKADKARFNLFGYGAIALYISLLAAVVAGVYGFNATSVMLSVRSSEQTREQMRSGQMVITTEDRTSCRTMHFNNETAELSKETLVDCDTVISEDRSSGGSFNKFRNGFMNR